MLSMEKFDILNPPVYWVGNRCYRVLTPDARPSHINYAEEDSYSQDEEGMYDDEAECGAGGGQQEYEIETLPSGKYKTAWHVPSAYYPYLIGAKGATRKRLEHESGCRIEIPPRGVTGDIVVTGLTPSKVRTGRLRVELVVEQARRKMPPTHFISVLANSQDIRDNFLVFQARVMGVCGQCRGVSEPLFQDPARLHLTLGVMALVDDQERGAAVTALQQAVAQAASLLPGGVMRLRVQGLHYFNDDPAEVRVLYAGVKRHTPAPAAAGGAALSSDGWAEAAAEDDWSAEASSDDASKDASPEHFQQFADNVMNSMVKAGLMKQEHEKVTLHITLLNTSFLLREDEENGGEADTGGGGRFRKERGPRETFDAREILQNFGDFDFGVLEVREVHLSVMHTTDPNTGYYSSTTVVPLAADATVASAEQLE